MTLLDYRREVIRHLAGAVGQTDPGTPIEIFPQVLHQCRRFGLSAVAAAQVLRGFQSESIVISTNKHTGETVYNYRTAAARQRTRRKTVRSRATQQAAQVPARELTAPVIHAGTDPADGSHCDASVDMPRLGGAS